MSAPAVPRILCVDDEPNVLDALKLHLRRRGEVFTAIGGIAALEMLAQPGFAPPALIISDMRMPKMDGAAFFAKARALVPDAVRVLLTGHADLDAAIAAVNDGNIFRFLTKPCPPMVLMTAVDAALAQHNLITAERVLLEQTLHGSINALVEVLSITSPLMFGRSSRVKALVAAMAEKLGIAERWPIEVAAMVAQLGAVALPSEVAEKHYYGKPLSPEEEAMVARVPALTEQLIAHIPRLEGVRGMLKQAPKGARAEPSSDPAVQVISRGANLLRAATDFDALTAAGNAPNMALDTMRGRAGIYEPAVLEALTALRGVAAEKVDIREVPLRSLKAGMILLDDVKLISGALLVARGFFVTESFLLRCANFKPGAVKEPLRVVVPPADA